MEKGSGIGEPNQSHPSKPASSVNFSSGRLRFTMEFNPIKTTHVSWKDLIKEANLSKFNLNSSSSPSLRAQCNFDSQPSLPPSVDPSSGNQTT